MGLNEKTYCLLFDTVLINFYSGGSEMKIIQKQRFTSMLTLLR